MLLAPLARLMVQSIGDDSGHSRGRSHRHKKKRRRSRSRSRRHSGSGSRSESRHRGRSRSSTHRRAPTPPPPPPPRKKVPATVVDGPPVLERQAPGPSRHGEGSNTSIIVPSIHSSVSYVNPVLPTSTVRTGTHEDLAPARVADSLTYVNVAHDKKDSDTLEKVLPVSKEKVLFVENRSVTKLTAAERIALAYKYDPSITPPPVVEKEKNTAFRGSDEDEKKDKEVKIKNPSTFPPSPAVTDAWFSYSKKHHKNTKPKVVYELTQQETTASAAAGTPPPEGGEAEQSTSQGKGVVKVDKGVTKKVVKNDALKEPPEKLKWTFDHHNPGWADVVIKDKDMGLIVLDDTKEHQMELRLCKKEWQNLQLAQNYILNAASHIQYYLTSSREAINQVLDTLDPAMEAPNIEKLQDTKAMLKGVGFGLETITGMAVYSHGGLTALQREQFLRQECGYIPEDAKGILIGQPFGSHYLYNGKISTVMPQIEQARKEHSERLMQKALLATLHKEEEKRRPDSRDRSSQLDDPFPGQSNLDYDTGGRGRGARGGRGGRGRGRPPKQHTQGNQGNRGRRGRNAGHGRDFKKGKQQGAPDKDFKSGGRGGATKN